MLKTLLTFQTVYGANKYHSFTFKAPLFIVLVFWAGLAAPVPALAATNVPYLDANGKQQIAPPRQLTGPTGREGYKPLEPGWYLASDQ